MVALVKIDTPRLFNEDGSVKKETIFPSHQKIKNSELLMLKLVIISVMVLVYIMYKRFSTKKIEKNRYSLNHHIKDEFIKISVNVQKVEILDRSYNSEVENTGTPCSNLQMHFMILCEM